ncbi:MAG TPA: hypothetical protein PK079_26050 [Leptospiraceae bacterium]|nr:hypothetical protein [Leptospiraceae bacterium]HMY29975.1 hypothetical protein [Leptospiraceae bacterium]HNC59930.1 hypothetical protein [Leptospiraceae bacterium]HNE11607.1 hypothetical protein [Leptospiraceae bacterium]HNE56652.1 hypothetical protein [Leptospiraceae bacterium]
MNLSRKFSELIKRMLTIPFFWTNFISIPAFMMLTTLFSILILILIDPISSAYIYFALNRKEGAAFSPVNFTSSDSYKTAIDVLMIVTFIYLVKTDAGFIDKFIKLLELLKSTGSNTKKALINSISKRGKGAM